MRVPEPSPASPAMLGVAPAAPVKPPVGPGGFAALLKQAPTAPRQLPEETAETEGAELVAVLDPMASQATSPWLPPRLHGLTPTLSALPEDLSVEPTLSRVLPTPAPRPAEQAESGPPTGDTAILEVPELLGLAPAPAPEEPLSADPAPIVELMPEGSRPAAQPQAPQPPAPVVHAPKPPPEDASLTFRKLGDDRLTLRVEDADGAMDVELTRDQSTLQVRVVAPVESLHHLTGLGSSIESALSALGLELGSYTTATWDDEPPESSGDGGGDGEGEGSGEVEVEAARTAGDRLLDMLV
jgi:hypothetical protein